ncbi:MAG TPA: ribonuclease III [Ktedonobacterales bacterium]
MAKGRDAAKTGSSPGMGAQGREDPLAPLEATLGYTFTQRQLLVDALTHRSYLNEAGRGAISNERLEFLGDAVLALVSAELVYRERPTEPEGQLTQLRVALVRTSTLANFARDLHLGSYLRLGRSEALLGGRDRESVIAAAFEAVLGAIYLDGGLAAAERFLDPLLRAALAATAQRSIKDAKSRLQELAQGRLGVTPRYRLVSTEGPSHDRRFVAEVLVGAYVAAQGEGRSKQQAEQEAAARALQDPGWLEAGEESSG